MLLSGQSLNTGNNSNSASGTAIAVTTSLLVLVVGVLVWVGFAYLVRRTTWVDRRLAGWQRHQPVASTYRRAGAPGVVPLLRTVSSDPQTGETWPGWESTR